uniref:Uncharacterized protein n=2 Tax=Knipowitschia caucasica TaxID=637954 RepID=A0AAV2M8H3_KNICA
MEKPNKEVAATADEQSAQSEENEKMKAVPRHKGHKGLLKQLAGLRQYAAGKQEVEESSSQLDEQPYRSSDEASEHGREWSGEFTEKVVKNMRHETEFIALHPTETTMEEIKSTIGRWDRIRSHENERGGGGSARTHKNYKGRASGSDQRQGGNKEHQDGGQREKKYPDKRRKGYLPPEEYNKLTVEEKIALRAKREAAAEGGQEKKGE